MSRKKTDGDGQRRIVLFSDLRFIRMEDRIGLQVTDTGKFRTLKDVCEYLAKKHPGRFQP